MVTKHSLGWDCGAIYDHGDGTVSFRQTAHLTDDFRVRVADVTGFSETKGGRKAFDWTLHIFGHGGELCTASVKRGDCERIEAWFRTRPDFGGNAQGPAARSDSVAEQLAQLASLRESGALTDAEFTVAKQRLLG